MVCNQTWLRFERITQVHMDLFQTIKGKEAIIRSQVTGFYKPFVPTATIE
jgi:hypothetical protein